MADLAFEYAKLTIIILIYHKSIIHFTVYFVIFIILLFYTFKHLYINTLYCDN